MSRAAPLSRASSLARSTPGSRSSSGAAYAVSLACAPLLALLWSSTASAQDLLPAGTPVTDAAIVDVTPEGFDAITGVIPALLPDDLAIDPLGEEYEGALGQCWLGGYGYEVSNMKVDVEIPSATIVPRNGYLEMSFDVQVGLNSSSDPFYVWTTLECIDSTCDAWVEPFTATIDTWIDLRIVEGPDGPALDASVGDLGLSYDLSGDNIELDGCALATINDILDFFGLNLFDIVLSFAGSFIDDAIGDFAPEIEAVLEESFASASIEEEIDLGGVAATIQLFPGDIQIKPEGLRLSMDGGMDTGEAAECIAQWDEGGSARVDGEPPDIGEGAADGSSGHHVGFMVSDEFANQALYNVWRAGLLCQVLDEELTGFPLNTALISLFIGEAGGEAISALFELPADLLILTRPEAPPTLVVNGDHDVVLAVNDLGLDFYADLDFRTSRILGVDLAADVGVELPFDGTTGELAPDIIFSGETLDPTVSHNEFAGGLEPEMEESFRGVVDTLVGPILADQLGGLAMVLPAIEGLGLTSLEVAPAGVEEDWLGIYANIGTVSYGGGGCDEEGGGCEAGCASGGRLPGRLALLALPLGLIVARRRRS